MNEQINEVARLDEMSEGKRSLHITMAPDGDIIVSIDYDGVPIQDNDGNRAVVEFCATSGGGGTSWHTRQALQQLYEAIMHDNRNRPDGIPPYPKYLAERQKEAIKK